MCPCVCSVIDHRWSQNVIKPKLWTLRSFVWSIRIQTMENSGGGGSCRFVFYNNIDTFWRPFQLKFLGKSCAEKEKANCAIMTSFPWTVLSSNIALDQFSAQEINSFIVKSVFGEKAKARHLLKNDIFVPSMNYFIHLCPCLHILENEIPRALETKKPLSGADWAWVWVNPIRVSIIFSCSNEIENESYFRPFLFPVPFIK